MWPLRLYLISNIFLYLAVKLFFKAFLRGFNVYSSGLISDNEVWFVNDKNEVVAKIVNVVS